MTKDLKTKSSKTQIPEKKKEYAYIERKAKILEMTLESFEIISRVAEINIEQYYIEFKVEIEIGTPISKVLNHKRDLALALMSPSGEVHIKAPIPGTNYIGIRIPNTELDNEKFKWRFFVGGSFILLGSWLEKIGYKIFFLTSKSKIQ